jgi:hypothetical protein
MNDGATAAPNLEPIPVNPQTFSLPNSGSSAGDGGAHPSSQPKQKKSRESAAKSAGKVKALHNTG